MVGNGNALVQNRGVNCLFLFSWVKSTDDTFRSVHSESESEP